VAVLLVPVEAGLLVLRRGIEPQRGKIALPGGYMEMNETWQQACIRECAEETNIALSVDKVTHFQTLSNGKDRVLIVGLYSQTLPAIPVFTLTEETAAIFVLNKADFKPEEIAFSLHTAVLQDWFSR
jgi:ADP-ribose pyrophosphatase YjhB (NUDIX family)